MKMDKKGDKEVFADWKTLKREKRKKQRRYYAKQWSKNWMPPKSSQPNACCWEKDAEPERDCWQSEFKKESDASNEQENNLKKTVTGCGWEHENDASERIALDIQKMANEEVQEFLGSSSEGEDSSSDDSSSEEDDVMTVPGMRLPKSGKERDEDSFKFFMQLFEDNLELQNLYKENWKVPSFKCLVCSTIPTRAAKRFNDIINLVTHATQVTRPPKVHAHRGYARALRCLLGWDEPGDPQL